MCRTPRKGTEDVNVEPFLKQFETTLGTITAYRNLSSWKFALGAHPGTESPTFDDSGWEERSLPPLPQVKFNTVPGFFDALAKESPLPSSETSEKLHLRRLLHDGQFD